MTSTLDFLREQYGPVMTIEQLAGVLSRKTDGLRGALLRPTEPWMHELNRVKRRIGRRVYFPVETIAALLDGELENSRGSQ